MPLRLGVLIASTALAVVCLVSIGDLTFPQLIGVSALAMFGAIGSTLIGRLCTVVRNNEITVRMFGLAGFRAPLDNIRSAEIVAYEAQAEFGGWGYRRLDRGIAFLARGDRAIEIAMTDGKRVWTEPNAPRNFGKHSRIDQPEARARVECPSFACASGSSSEEREEAAEVGKQNRPQTCGERSVVIVGPVVADVQHLARLTANRSHDGLEESASRLSPADFAADDECRHRSKRRQTGDDASQPAVEVRRDADRQSAPPQFRN
jgi:hypothetical protein